MALVHPETILDEAVENSINQLTYSYGNHEPNAINVTVEFAVSRRAIILSLPLFWWVKEEIDSILLNPDSVMKITLKVKEIENKL